MKDNFIEDKIKNKWLTKKTPDKKQAMSLLESSENNANEILKIDLSEKNAQIVFREMYESIRQLGDAAWNILGYVAENHEVTLEVLKESEKLSAEQKNELNWLSRFKNIRNDLNYRGFKITREQAKEIVEFWNKVGKFILEELKEKAR